MQSIWVESCQKVDVICRTTDFQGLASFASDDSTDVWVEIASQCRIDSRESVLCAEYDVICETGVRAHWTLVCSDCGVRGLRRPVGSSLLC